MSGVLTRERVLELFIYVAWSGELIRKVPKANQAAGTIAGSVNARGHVNIQVDGRIYAAHQLVYLIHHNLIPPEIDHINQDKTDNRIENLRPCTSSQNKGNIGLLVNNKTGYRGVSLNSKSGKYHAQIKIHGKQTYLGRFDTPEEAALVYNEAAREHFGEFAYQNVVVPKWLQLEH